MAKVETDFDLYSRAQQGQSTKEYYKILTSIVDIINTSGGRAGLHPTMFKRHFVSVKDKEVL